ncbi:MAG: ABC transporter permease [Pseudomonadota bacterium]|nr:ABC transporter permease [Pseudomonadota bacterium]
MSRLAAIWVIARRDFAATVLSRAFILFLVAPLFPVLLGGLFGGIGARVAAQTAQPVVAVVMSKAEFEALWQARHRLAEAAGEARLVQLVGYAPEGNRDKLVKRLLASKDPPVRAVLTGWFGDPRLVGDVREGDETSRQVAYMLQRAVMPDIPSPTLEVVPTRGSPAALAQKRAITGQVGQMALFFLTILLAGMLLSQMVEEKSNKIIEVIAAAVPIDTLFVGKLLAMLAASIIGIVVWVGAGAAAIAVMSNEGLGAMPLPAVGWAWFLGLGIVYFAMNYMLLGAVFLGIGAQASTVREVQTLSMPVTFIQVIVFGFAALSVGNPNSSTALGAALFPLSSPLVMIDRAAELPELWPHLMAILWQGLWVGLILWAGARLFRRTVLKSGPATGKRRRWRRRSSPAPSGA